MKTVLPLGVLLSICCSGCQTRSPTRRTVRPSRRFRYLGRIRKLRRQFAVRVGWARLPHLSEDRAHPKEHGILPILGLILGVLVGIRLGDNLESLTALLIGLAARRWLFFLVFYVVLAGVAIIVGGFAGHSVIPRSSRQRITCASLYASGGGGVLAGLLIFTVTKVLPMTNHFTGEQSRASFELSVLALSLVGGSIRQFNWFSTASWRA